MHKSRLCGLIIDCNDDDLDEHAAFWCAALGRGVEPRDVDSNYVTLTNAVGEMRIELQRVTHPSRVHIDIETDDVELETRRLEKLGARRIGRVRDWNVMQAPSGHRFCIVPAVAEDFDDEANVWE